MVSGDLDLLGDDPVQAYSSQISLCAVQNTNMLYGQHFVLFNLYKAFKGPIQLVPKFNCHILNGHLEIAMVI